MNCPHCGMIQLLLNQLLLISPSDADWIWGLLAWIPERLNYQYSSHLETCDSKVMRDFHIIVLITIKIMYV